MARRPKRSLAEELMHHAVITVSARDLVGALAKLQPDVAEFIVAKRMLDDAVALLLDRRREVEAIQLAQQPSLVSEP